MTVGVAAKSGGDGEAGGLKVKTFNFVIIVYSTWSQNSVLVSNQKCCTVWRHIETDLVV